MERPNKFDSLAAESYKEGASRADLDALWKAVFELEYWCFLARTAKTGLQPYVGRMQEKPMLLAFTDTNKLQDFAKEQNLMETDGSVKVLTIPVKGSIEYLTQFGQFGVEGIWFNSNKSSHGFYTLLTSLKPIEQHLENLKK